jgi:hypothetical protein
VRVEYDAQANAIAITIAERTSADRGDEVHPRAIVALEHGEPVAVQLLYPDAGLDDPIGVVAHRYGLDREALNAAARAALAAPDRTVMIELGPRAEPSGTSRDAP